MSSLTKTYVVRDPIHGLIEFNDLEWDVINSKSFQRLRRIKQLAWTDYIYPGAGHTRFEHSLGVCHVASRLFDSIVRKNEDILRTDYGFRPGGLDRQRQIIRLAALSHDLGHGPFSHAAEEAFPVKASGKRWVHEEYSAGIVQTLLKEIIENHPINKNNHGIRVEDVSSMFDGTSLSVDAVVWRELIAGQMDADRMDYLLRDSYHSGVTYGRYDLDRVIDTVCLCKDAETSAHLIGIGDDGLHAVEGLLIARYMMFTQVYYHKTRVIYDYHYDKALRFFLEKESGFFPSPEASDIASYLDWDDWRIHNLIKSHQKDNEDCKALFERNHRRLIFETVECPSLDELDRFDRVKEELKEFDPVSRDAKKSWYKYQRDEIRVKSALGKKDESAPLAALSPVVNGLQTVNQRRLYVPNSVRGAARERLNRQ